MFDKGPTASNKSRSAKYSTQKGLISVLEVTALGPKLCKGSVVTVGSGVKAIAGSELSCPPDPVTKSVMVKLLPTCNISANAVRAVSVIVAMIAWAISASFVERRYYYMFLKSECTAKV
jgi:hypothetical protein